MERNAVLCLFNVPPKNILIIHTYTHSRARARKQAKRSHTRTLPRTYAHTQTHARCVAIADQESVRSLLDERERERERGTLLTISTWQFQLAAVAASLFQLAAVAGGTSISYAELLPIGCWKNQTNIDLWIYTELTILSEQPQLGFLLQLVLLIAICWLLAGKAARYFLKNLCRCFSHRCCCCCFFPVVLTLLFIPLFFFVLWGFFCFCLVV